MMYTVCNRHPLLCEKIVLWLLQLYIIQQRVSLFCAIFGIYSFIVTIAIPENNAKNSALQNVNYCVTDFRRTNCFRTCRDFHDSTKAETTLTARY
mgnify:FL=1